MNTRNRTIGTICAVLLALAALAACDAPVSAEQGSKAVSSAKKELGVPYVYGGSTPATGFDCSGLTSWAWKQAGVDIPRTATDQYNASQRITKADLQPGDLIFYGYNGVIQHVGMYEGNGKEIHSPKPGLNVEEVTLATWWTDALIGYGRGVGPYVPPSSTTTTTTTAVKK